MDVRVIDPETLKAGYSRVEVECLKCKALVLRENTHAMSRHACSGSEGYMNPAEYPIVTLQIKLLDPLAKIPFKARSTDAADDLHAVEDVVVTAGKITKVRTGLAISAPEGYYFSIEGRSSLFQKQIFAVRGILDSTYCGETIVALANFGEDDYHIKTGDRIAQMIVHKTVMLDFQIVEEFSPSYNKRGTLGFGSSGV